MFADYLYRPPCCPDCNSEMVFITEDMSEQGGPPENTWLCSKSGCGRALGSYQPNSPQHVCVPNGRPRG